MSLSISAIGYGFAAVLGAGAILLALVGNGSWPIFLGTGFLSFILGKMIG